MENINKITKPTGKPIKKNRGWTYKKARDERGIWLQIQTRLKFNKRIFLILNVNKFENLDKLDTSLEKNYKLPRLGRNTKLEDSYNY